MPLIAAMAPPNLVANIAALQQESSSLSGSSDPSKQDRLGSSRDQSSVEPPTNIQINEERSTSPSSQSSNPACEASSVALLKSLNEEAVTGSGPVDPVTSDTPVACDGSERVKEESDADSPGNLLDQTEIHIVVPDSPRNIKKENSSEYLESLSRSILNACLNLKDNQHPLVMKHQAVDFRNKHDALPKATNRSDHHSNLAKHLAENENFHIQIHNTSSEVDDSRGRATVYLWYEISGLAHGIEREAVAVLSWERKQGVWVIMKHIGMRGAAGFC